jgi:hypothetical protein
MKLAFPLYEGDSLLRPMPSRKTKAVGKPRIAEEMLQRRVTFVPGVHSSFDLEIQARVLRREYLRQWIKGIFDRKDD